MAKVQSLLEQMAANWKALTEITWGNADISQLSVTSFTFGARDALASHCFFFFLLQAMAKERRADTCKAVSSQFSNVSGASVDTDG